MFALLILMLIWTKTLPILEATLTVIWVLSGMNLSFGPPIHERMMEPFGRAMAIHKIKFGLNL